MAVCVQKAIYYVCEGAAFHAVAYNRATFNGTRQVGRATTLSLVNNTPPTPIPKEHNHPPSHILHEMHEEGGGRAPTDDIDSTSDHSNDTEVSQALIGDSQSD